MNPPHAQTPLTHSEFGLRTFEARLANDTRWALSEGSLFFEGKGAVQQTLRRIAQRLQELGVAYSVAGGMALFHQGYQRFTEYVDILITREGLKAIHEGLDGRGYVRPFERSKNLRDAETRVKIEFLIAGDYPGDGKPQPVRFPEPQSVALERDGILYLKLPSLVELKLASGMTGRDRLRDLADVQELIRILSLPPEFAEQLDPSVRAKFSELWSNLQVGPKRYVMLWPFKGSGAAVPTFDDLIASAPESGTLLQTMRDDGVVLDESSRSAGSVLLVTSDPQVAKRYGMEDEAEMWTDDGEQK